MGDTREIYFLECVGAGAIKIGWAADVLARIAALQTGCPLDGFMLSVTGPSGVVFSIALTAEEWAAVKGKILEALR